VGILAPPLLKNLLRQNLKRNSGSPWCLRKGIMQKENKRISRDGVNVTTSMIACLTPLPLSSSHINE